MHAILELREVLLSVAERHIDVAMPSQTFLQHAQPTSFGHWFGMWSVVLERDTARMRAVFERINESPAGAGILTGSDFAVDRYRTAELLGFSRPLANTWDAILSHDTGLEAISTVATFWTSLARLADDIEYWSATEVGMLDIPDRFCDTSSVMPQKRNPSLPQQLKAQAAKAVGAMTTAYIAEKGPTGGPMLERNEADRLLWELLDAVPPLTRNLGRMLEALAPNTVRMRQLAAGHWATASDLAGLLVRQAACRGGAHIRSSGYWCGCARNEVFVLKG